MKKIFAVVVGLVAVATMQIAVAQEQRPATPVEFYGCNWQDGKGMADLVKVGQKFSKWADKRDSKYSAWILSPQFQTDVGFDVGWLGGWPSGAEMGKTLDAWKSDGQDLAAEFDAVMDCSNRHELATVVEINAPNGPGGNGIVMFDACTVADGKTGADAIAAHAKAGAMMKGKGAKATSTWAFFPALGTGDYDFDYWRVITFDNYSDFGATSDIFINGGGWQESMKIMGGVTQCERGVIFDATSVRLVPAS